MITPIENEEDVVRLYRSIRTPGGTAVCVGGQRVVLVSQGERNSGPGPDFLNAVLLIDGVLTVGSVEIHVRERDWFAHGHQHDPEYESVVLHVLGETPERKTLRLPLPTISATELNRRDGGRFGGTDSDDADAPGAPGSGQDESGGGLAPGDLAEFAWVRLLRRTLEVLRQSDGAGDHVELVTRALILRLFDSLGFSRNREPMKATAGRVLELRDHLTDLGFDETAALLFGLSGIPAGRLEKIGRSFMPESRLPFVLPVGMPQLGPVGWDYNVRPANAPERRLWGGAKLLFDIIRRRLLEQAHDELRHGRSVTRLRSMFHVKLGSETLLGNSRADDIVVNALLPVALAAGLLRNDFRLVAGSCLTYRNWPSLASNRIVREVERRFADGADIAGAFFQQGAIEYYQRVLSPDRSGYSMIAEKPGTEKERNGI